MLVAIAKPRLAQSKPVLGAPRTRATERGPEVRTYACNKMVYSIKIISSILLSIGVKSSFGTFLYHLSGCWLLVMKILGELKWILPPFIST